MSLKIKKQSIEVFEVKVLTTTPTTHLVTITDEVHNKLTKKLVTKESLLEFSFQFLMDRESNTSILPSFNITDISKYFPDYSDQVNCWCDKKS